MMISSSYLCGYYGMRNTGDDALLLATAWGAKWFLGDDSARVSNVAALKLPGMAALGQGLKTRQLFRGENRLRQYVQAAFSSRVIFGGGSVLHNSHDINLKRQLMALSGKGRALALGVGIGPFTDTEAENNCSKFLNECQFVGLRDQQSYELAKQIAPNANVKLTFDLAPLLLLNKALPKTHSKRAGVCFCLCPHERLAGDIDAEKTRLTEISRAIVELYEQTGEVITLLDFNGHNQLGDEQVHTQLRQMLPDNIPVLHIPYQQNPLKVLQKLTSFKVVVSMRLHGSVMAFLAKTPFVSLNYHSKCEGWCQQIGQPRHLQFNLKNFDKTALVGQLCAGIEYGFDSPTLTSLEAVSMSLENWSINNEANIKSDIGGYSVI